MEFDADSYEVKMTGSETFGQTSRRMREMNVGVHYGYGDLRATLRHGKLPSHLPAFVVQRTSCVPSASRAFRRPRSQPRRLSTASAEVPLRSKRSLNKAAIRLSSE